MNTQTAFGAAFLAALMLLAYCIFVLPPKHLDMAAQNIVESRQAISRHVQI